MKALSEYDHPFRHRLPFLITCEIRQHGRVMTSTETTEILYSAKILRSTSNRVHTTTVQPATGLFRRADSSTGRLFRHLLRHYSDSSPLPADQEMLWFLTTH
ncbi:hypothetical protein MRX96_022085 [Rhipicephalus microplus]